MLQFFTVLGAGVLSKQPGFVWSCNQNHVDALAISPRLHEINAKPTQEYIQGVPGDETASSIVAMPVDVPGS